MATHSFGLGIRLTGELIFLAVEFALTVVAVAGLRRLLADTSRVLVCKDNHLSGDDVAGDDVAEEVVVHGTGRRERLSNVSKAVKGAEESYTHDGQRQKPKVQVVTRDLLSLSSALITQSLLVGNEELPHPPSAKA